MTRLGTHRSRKNRLTAGRSAASPSCRAKGIVHLVIDDAVRCHAVGPVGEEFVCGAGGDSVGRLGDAGPRLMRTAPADANSLAVGAPAQAITATVSGPAASLAIASRSIRPGTKKLSAPVAAYGRRAAWRPRAGLQRGRCR